MLNFLFIVYFVFKLKKVLKSIPNEMYVVETETRTHGVPYSDTFSVTTRFCLVRCDQNLTKLLVHASLNFSTKPNFVVKSKQRPSLVFLTVFFFCI